MAPLRVVEKLDVIEDVLEEKPKSKSLLWADKSCAIVVLASGGYPGKYEKNLPIKGLEEANCVGGAHIIQAGTAHGDEGLVTNGGRVLGSVGEGKTLRNALSTAYSCASRIQFPNSYYRHDIGAKAL